PRRAAAPTPSKHCGLPVMIQLGMGAAAKCQIILARALRVCKEIIWTLCCWPPGPLARRERRAIPGAVCEERATKPAGLRAAAQRGAAAKGAYRLCCRSSTMSDIAFVAAPRICPPGARAKMGTYFCASPKDDPSKVRNYATVYRLCKAHHHRIGVRCCRNCGPPPVVATACRQSALSLEVGRGRPAGLRQPHEAGNRAASGEADPHRRS